MSNETVTHKERLAQMERQISNEMMSMMLSYPSKRIMWYHLERAETQLVELRIYLYNIDRVSGAV